MPSLFNPRLVNDPAGDPALFIPFSHQKRALLIDAGDLSTLSPRDILKISHIFITHTHMDHFIGFDQILRIDLGRDVNLHVYGPEGFIDHVSAKLGGYAWNLVDNYETSLTMTVTEIRDDALATSHFACRDRFAPTPKVYEPATAGKIYQDSAFWVDAVLLDHGIGCVGYAVNERFNVNIRKDRLAEMELTPGPWLFAFKQALYDKKDPYTSFEVPSDGKHGLRQFTIGELAEQLAIIREGKKIAYIADAAFTDINTEKIIRLARGADHLFIEAAFLDADQELAARKKHLTARQAGWLAAAAEVGRFSLFHFSPRYSGQWDQFFDEAMTEFNRMRGL